MDVSGEAMAMDRVIEGVPIGGIMQEIDIVGLLVEAIEWEVMVARTAKFTTVKCEVNGQRHGRHGRGCVKKMQCDCVLGILHDFVTATGGSTGRLPLTRREKLEVFDELWCEYNDSTCPRKAVYNWSQEEKAKQATIDADNRIRPGLPSEHIRDFLKQCKKANDKMKAEAVELGLTIDKTEWDKFLDGYEAWEGLQV